jgi:hypothetical protein
MSPFNVNVPAVSKHLKNIFDSGELEEYSVISILETTAADGKNYKTKYYNLDAIIAVGYRVNSYQATQFRIWARPKPWKNSSSRRHGVGPRQLSDIGWNNGKIAP